MDGTVAEIRGFAGHFAPRNWFYCEGQSLPINQFGALYSLLGTNFGGDGVNTFKLPDLRGRAFIHHGTGPGLTNKPFASQGGLEFVTLEINEMPKHDHAAATQGGSGSLSGHATAKMFVNNETGDQSAPANNFLGFESNEGGFYADAKDANSMLNIEAIHVDTSGLNVDVNGIEVAVGYSGSSEPHYNMQPYLAMNFIICHTGYYPQRPT